jgi:flagellar hook protein FlgE
MDIESNNIANVNTTGFKYSRANFSDLLAQTRSIATAPQGELGGKNAVQVGLGSTVSSATTIFAQGSIQNSDKNTDIAVQGDGFFIVSPDGGKNYKYTRAGDFKFDANGNFVDNNGFIVQGWVRDEVTGKVDSTAPIENINIPPGLTTPASPTTEVVLKANLNSGTLVESFSPAYEVPSGIASTTSDLHGLDKNGNPIQSGDLGVLFNPVGEAFSLQENQGIWASFIPSAKTDSANNSVDASSPFIGANVTATDGTDDSLHFSIGGIDIHLDASGEAKNIDQTGAYYVNEINTQIEATGNTTITAIYDSANDKITITNTGQDPVDIGSHSDGAADDFGTSGISTTAAFGGEQLDISFELDNGDVVSIRSSGGTGTETEAENANRYISAINAKTSVTGITASYDIANNKINLQNKNSTASASHNIKLTVLGTDNSGLTTGNDITAYRYQYTSSATLGGTGIADGDKKFTTIADLRNQMEIQAKSHTVDTDGDGNVESNLEIIVNDKGKIEIKNPGGADDAGYSVELAITAMNKDSVFGGGPTENVRFTENMRGMNGVLPEGTTSSLFTQAFNAATHSSSIDIFDSLGSKHTLRMEFRKTSLSLEEGSRWDMTITVPSPSTLTNGTQEQRGYIEFDNTGALKAEPTPSSVNFSGNNGSKPLQPVILNFGSISKFDGMTSFDSRSSTSGISQDGFTGGDLVGIRIDQSGTMVGSFSNGRSFGLAQVSMAKFTNNEGLSTEGGSVYVQTANSGDPIIGTAATSGRGFIQSSALEASNVDLSRSLTQLIIIQRGYQANGKTITTSDQLLQTLIGLKN